MTKHKKAVQNYLQNYLQTLRTRYRWVLILYAGEFELMFTNTGVHKIVRISKTNQDNPNL